MSKAQEIWHKIQDMRQEDPWSCIFVLLALFAFSLWGASSILGNETQGVASSQQGVATQQPQQVAASQAAASKAEVPKVQKVPKMTSEEMEVIRDGVTYPPYLASKAIKVMLTNKTQVGLNIVSDIRFVLPFDKDIDESLLSISDSMMIKRDQEFIVDLGQPVVVQHDSVEIDTSHIIETGNPAARTEFQIIGDVKIEKKSKTQLKLSMLFHSLARPGQYQGEYVIYKERLLYRSPVVTLEGKRKVVITLKAFASRMTGELMSACQMKALKEMGIDALGNIGAPRREGQGPALKSQLSNPMRTVSTSPQKTVAGGLSEALTLQEELKISEWRELGIVEGNQSRPYAPDGGLKFVVVHEVGKRASYALYNDRGERLDRNAVQKYRKDGQVILVAKSGAELRIPSSREFEEAMNTTPSDRSQEGFKIFTCISPRYKKL